MKYASWQSNWNTWFPLNRSNDWMHFFGFQSFDSHGVPTSDDDGNVLERQEKNLASFSPPAELTVLGVKAL
jgi:hypothetical protein